MSKPVSILKSLRILRQSLRQRILAVNAAEFEPLALDIFRYQAVWNPVYRAYLGHLGVQPEQINALDRIPFMPIGFFKQHTVVTRFSDEPLPEPLIFASSGTTGRTTARAQATEATSDQVPTSHHLVPDPDLYNEISQRIFEAQYGPLDRFHILALLPSYLERNNSSLVYMVQRFIEKSDSQKSGFFLQNTDELTAVLQNLAEQPDGRPILLIGVTFALLDWAESATDFTFLQKLPDLIVMETGGMKGRRRELLREEVHHILTQRLGISAIHSEYGMTELLSQAYSSGGGIFQASPTLRVLLRDVNDPFYSLPRQADGRQTGGINVIDLANLDSCSFIETQDLGQYENETADAFRVIGRFDNSDIRGCNLMAL
ncbi:acyl transferase [Tellurirhabdus bombi]|uniref:acyl transferase n=1 Tax=Tellurirhabdus bombi TaxID=2907205 RepID=UPI001F2A6F06|nr:acyl transferase [Tellurirhabdus bombi]